LTLFLIANLSDASELHGRFDIGPAPVMVVLTGLVLCIKLLELWVKHFRAKAEWERRQIRVVGKEPPSTDHK
jgi:hypothetical protein